MRKHLGLVMILAMSLQAGFASTAVKRDAELGEYRIRVPAGWRIVNPNPKKVDRIAVRIDQKMGARLL